MIHVLEKNKINKLMKGIFIITLSILLFSTQDGYSQEIPEGAKFIDQQEQRYGTL